MSKSKKNVVDPNVLLDRYGADTTRLFCLFATPPERDLEWSEQGVEGSSRFLNRVWRLTWSLMDRIGTAAPYRGPAQALDGDIRQLYKKIHQTVFRVTRDIDERFHFNTAISAVMELVNTLYGVDLKTQSPEKDGVLRCAMETVVLLLSPMVPHFAEEIWAAMGKDESILRAPWPTYREDALVREELEIVVQVNGKLRSRFTAAADADDQALHAAALADERVCQFVGDKPVRKVIVVKKKLVNIVI